MDARTNTHQGFAEPSPVDAQRGTVVIGSALLDRRRWWSSQHSRDGESKENPQLGYEDGIWVNYIHLYMTQNLGRYT